ncbi:MAG: lysophospholipase [Anaerolineae bacterium]|nr:lysophospholipase [Anaerolineae bacterium]
MSLHPLDDLAITSQLFHVRKTQPGIAMEADTVDGTLPVADDVALGYRYYPAPGRPIIIFWHGNGEMVADYDLLAPLYRLAGAALLVIDYRGYGWSSGTPLTSRLLPDALAALDALPAVLAAHGAAQAPLFMKGRSLGSAPAIYLAQQRPARLRGLLLDSAFADAPSLFRRLGIGLPDALMHDPALPLNNVAKLATVPLPLLVLHGSADTLIPPEQGQALYAAAPTTDKMLVLIPGGQHNDLLLRDTGKYFGAVKTFIERHAGN